MKPSSILLGVSALAAGYFVYIKYFRKTEQVSISSIAISPQSATIAPNTTKQLTTECKNDNDNVIDCPDLTWKSSNSSVATVDSNGLVKGISAGTTTITVSYNTIQDTCNITVSTATVTLDKIVIPTDVNVPVGASDRYIQATCKDQNNNVMECPGTLSWSIIDGSSYIDITSTGRNIAKIHGKSVGTAHINAKYG